MSNQFHRNLNRMALFAAFVIAGVILFNKQFLSIAVTNIWLNGIIIGATVFGIGLCFADIFKLLPEYRWMKKYFVENKSSKLPPRLLRPVAIILQHSEKNNNVISTNTLSNFLDMIIGRFEDQRESVRYITNTLIFLGLLGTFWGLIHTVGGFAELVGNLNFDDENIMNAVQMGLAKPLAGMGTAFTSSLFGLAGSLIVGFLGLQVQLAQNSIFRDLEENLSARARISESNGFDTMGTLPQINLATKELSRAVQKLEKTVSKLT
ncbi:MAG: flagellar motor protein MotA [Alphaproteobacteria bacterium]|nr:flagellar motor protein MotA [Alphaproteobacteria bacterium]MBN2675062.1 flagellar motor protein MotA [Alphaproteobacteria bacterium]